MSHFLALVVLPRSYDPTEASSVHELLQKILEPYDENRDVAPYDTPCWCIGSEAIRRTHTYMGVFQASYPPRPEPAPGEAWENLTYRTRLTTWEEGLEREQETFLAAQPDQEAPTQDCEMCHGTGVQETTRNPLSQWDWWVLGGRWDGWFEEEARPGTGPLGFPGKENETPEHNVLLIDELLAIPMTNWVGYALVTPGPDPKENWHQKGKMGWFGMSNGDKEQGAWQQEVRTLLERYRGQYVAGCDLHI